MKKLNFNNEDSVTLRFECDDKKYVVCTNSEFDETGNLMYYAGILDGDEECVILPIETEREFSVIEMVLRDCLFECWLKESINGE